MHEEPATRVVGAADVVPPNPRQHPNTKTMTLHSLDEISEALGVSVAHLRREVRLRRLAVHRFGRLIRVSGEDLAIYLAARRRGAR